MVNPVALDVNWVADEAAPRCCGPSGVVQSCQRLASGSHSSPAMGRPCALLGVLQLHGLYAVIMAVRLDHWPLKGPDLTYLAVLQVNEQASC